jgi:hypothetical protein
MAGTLPVATMVPSDAVTTTGPALPMVTKPAT